MKVAIIARRLCVLACGLACGLGWGLAFAEPAPAAKPAAPKAAAKAAPQKKDGRKTIAVITEFDGVYNVLGDRHMFSDPDRRQIPIADWAMDKFAVSVASAALKERFAVEGLALSPAAREALQEKNMPSAFWGNRDEYICKALHGLTPARRYDYYLWIASSSMQGERIQAHIRWLGVSKWNGVYQAHAIFVTLALDGQTCHRKDYDFPAKNKHDYVGILTGQNWIDVEVGEAEFESAIKGTINKKLKDATVGLFERLLAGSVRKLFAPD